MRCLQQIHLFQEYPMTALRQRMIEDLQVRNLLPNTQDSYVLQFLDTVEFGKAIVFGPDVD